MFEDQAIASPSRNGFPEKSAVTPWPRPQTRPTPSWPSTTGKGIRRWPWWRCTSVPHTPARSTRATTAPGPGAGTDADSIFRGALNSLSTTAAACDWDSITFLGPPLTWGQPRLIVGTPLRSIRPEVEATLLADGVLGHDYPNSEPAFTAALR